MTARPITCLTDGEQSGVSTAVARALALRAHDVHLHDVTGPLEWRRDGRLRPARGALPHLLHATLSHGRGALRHRWNTPHAFDAPSREAARSVAGSARDALVLQNEAPLSPQGTGPTCCSSTERALSRWRSARCPPRGATCRATAGRRGGSGSGRPTLGRGRSRRSPRVWPPACGPPTASPGSAPTWQARARRCSRSEPGARTTAARSPFIGRDFRRKGGPVLVAVFERGRRAVPEARLLVAGPREALSLPEGTVQLGPVLHARLEPLLAATSVFVLPTLREPFGLALLDAMACRVPCVASAAEAVPGIVDEGVTGLLTPRATPTRSRGPSSRCSTSRCSRRRWAARAGSE